MSRPNIVQVAFDAEELRELKRRASELGVPVATYAYMLLKAALAQLREKNKR